MSGKPDVTSLNDLKRALAFYENVPDGQYDTDIVVPVLRAEIERRMVNDGLLVQTTPREDPA